MHPYSTNSPAPPKHIAYMMLAAIALSALAGSIVKYANTRWGWALGGISAMTLFTALYFAFEHAAWKWPIARHFLLVPDLNGVWRCEGKTLFKNGAPQEYTWSARITIRQSWSKITVITKTAQSSSQSIAASVFREPGNGFRLIYHYDNKPDLGERDLARHCGLCNLLFREDIGGADGEYFTDKDRMTAGTMRLTREGATNEQARST